MYRVTIMYFGGKDQYDCDSENTALSLYDELIEKHQCNHEVLCEIHLNKRIYKHYYRLGSKVDEILCK